MADRMVGRQRELGALLAWVGAARDGAGRLVLCAGGPGIGKTRLAQEIAGVALADGMAVAWGRCFEAEGASLAWCRSRLGAHRPCRVAGGSVPGP